MATPDETQCAYRGEKPQQIHATAAPPQGWLRELRVRRAVGALRDGEPRLQLAALSGPTVAFTRAGELELGVGNYVMKGCIETDLASRAQPIVDALRSSGRSVVTAESCTGGLVAAILSHAENASDCLHGGFVAYTKAQKHAALGLDCQLMQLQGTVNGEVARLMAEGALRRSPATLALSVTGVLGPNPDEDGNPPGLVFLGLAESGKPTVTVCQEFGKTEDPDYIRRETIARALDMLLRAAQGRA